MQPDLFRKIFGAFPTGVSVVATAVGGELHGITVNSITSVSLDPLLVLVCIDRKAIAHSQIERAERFGVSFLGEGQEHASRLFALSRPPETGHLRGAGYRIGPHGTPLLEDSVAWIECRVEQRFPAGDHTIFLASVLDGSADPDAEPLVFHRGRYRRLHRDA